MFSKIKNFIIKIQNSDEAVKKFWLIIFSAITMAIVISFWLMNSNLGVAKITGLDTETQTNIEEQKTTVKETFMAGFNAIANTLKEKISSTKQLFIKASDRNFILDNVKEVPKTQLP